MENLSQKALSELKKLFMQKHFFQLPMNDGSFKGKIRCYFMCNNNAATNKYF